MTGPPGPDDALVVMLDELLEAVGTAPGVGDVFIALARPDGRFEVASVAGTPEAKAALLGCVHPAEVWEGCLAATSREGRLGFLQTRDWQPADVVLTPLSASGGALRGVLGMATAAQDQGAPAPAHDPVAQIAAITGLAIEHAIGRSGAEAEQDRLRQQAMSDALTGIGSRTLLLDRLRHASTARPESGEAMALAFIDLDNFKVVNDQQTHVAGDHVLRTVAQRIESAVRAHDTVARWGGDEFLVLLQPLADEHSALGAVKRILAAIAEPITDLDHPLELTASIGVSFWTPDAPVEVDELLRRADAAMYEAKRRGANGFVVYDVIDAEASRRLHVQNLLLRAVEEERVVVQYQPIVRVADERIVAVEALVRLRDDDDSLVHPLELLQHGAPPGDVARTVLSRATLDVARWVERGHDLSLSINVSAHQMADAKSLGSDVRTALDMAGLAAHRLVLELTEQALPSTSAQAQHGFTDLVSAGVRFSLDDFGAGFGSMTHVQQLPVHELKIDQSFVAAAQTHRPSIAIIRSVAALAADLGIHSVAQGVENAAQHDIVRAAGVTLAQGSHYSGPVEADAFQALLDDRQQLSVTATTEL